MGWKKHPQVRREQRSEQTREFMKKLSSGQLNNYKVLEACYEEICEESPQDVFYSLEDLKFFLGIFLIADRNLDAAVSFSELKYAMEKLSGKALDEKYTKGLEECFNAADVSGDQKLNLAEWLIIGFLREDRKANYEAAIRVESE